MCGDRAAKTIGDETMNRHQTTTDEIQKLGDRGAQAFEDLFRASVSVGRYPELVTAGHVLRILDTRVHPDSISARLDLLIKNVMNISHGILEGSVEVNLFANCSSRFGVAA
jgi:hypothetical protein